MRTEEEIRGTILLLRAHVHRTETLPATNATEVLEKHYAIERLRGEISYLAWVLGEPKVNL